MPRVKLSPRHKILLNKLNEEVHTIRLLSYEIHYVFSGVKCEYSTFHAQECFVFTVKIVGMYIGKDNKRVSNKPSSTWVRFVNKSIKNHSWVKCKSWTRFFTFKRYSCDTKKVIWDLK